MSKTIVITGAGEGLGRALARRFAREGERVILLGRTAEKIEAVAREIGGRALAVSCDVSSAESVRHAFTAIAACVPRIDVLINNAGIYRLFAIADATDEQILASVGTNLSGPMFCVREALPLMDEGSHIINVTSEGVELPFPLMSVYQATKAGLERFTTAIYRELEPQGIKVSYVRAGAMAEEGKGWRDVEPEVGARFARETAANGLSGRGISHYDSVTQVFRSLIDMPDDVHALGTVLFGRKS